MSSNRPHINITRSNYEEYFLLYVDGELTPEECDAVEAFTATHPDLQEELDTLLSTRLDSEPVVFFDKSALMAESMKTTAIDESLLLYIDDELKGAEKKELEKELKNNPDYQLQHQLLLQTKLDPKEKIVYPYKEELYRVTERKTRPMYWVRAAAAVIILLGWGSFWYMDNYSEEGTGGPIALEPVTGPQTVVITPAPKNNTAPAAEVTVPVEESSIPSSSVAFEPSKGSSAASVDRKKATPSEKITVAPDETTIAYSTPATTEEVVLEERTRVQTIEGAPQQNFNTPGVTEKIAGTYHKVEVPTDYGTAESVASADNDKKGSLRGFLRKTTRFIERRTGIDPTNEDDELLIGAIAIKLK